MKPPKKNEKGHLILPNHTQFPNEVIDVELPSMTGYELKVFTVICRQLIGYHRIEKQMTDTYLMLKTGIKGHNNLTRAVKGLIKKGLIIQHRIGKSKATKTTYRLNYYVSDLDI